MFSYVTLEQRVPKNHPLREIRKQTQAVLRSLSGDFDCLYAGRRASLHRPRVCVAGATVAGVLFGAE
jgi:hypothetical protein